jgi:hypothetical protein
MANYRVSTNTNNSNKTTQDRTSKTTTKQRKMDQLGVFKLKHDLLKISADLQAAFLVVTVSGYRSRGLGFDSRRFQIFRQAAGLERGPLSLVRTTEELLGRKRSGFGLEHRD